MHRSHQLSTYCSRLKQLAALGCLLCFSSLSADTVDGFGYISSLKGGVRITTADEASFKPDLHDTFPLNATRLNTEPTEQVILNLSNTIALGLHENTELRIPRFKQVIFTEEKASVRREPSTSELVLSIIEGTTVIAAAEQAPLSEFNLELPIGYAIFRNAHAQIQCSPDEIKISLLEGTMTYFPAPNSRPRYLAAPIHTVINQQTLKQSVLPENSIEETLTPDERAFAEAVAKAPDRVYFPRLNAEDPIQAIAIADPSYHKKPNARPYEFKERTE